MEGVSLHLYGILAANLPDKRLAVFSIIISLNGDSAHCFLVFLLDVCKLKLTVVELAAVSYIK